VRVFITLERRHAGCRGSCGIYIDEEGLRMPNRAAEWARHHELGQSVFVGKDESARTAVDLADAAPVVPVRPEPPGAAGRLARILMAMVRQTYVGPRERERVRANADRLLETIRVLSAL
jgi:hypothetical protein